MPNSAAMPLTICPTDWELMLGTKALEEAYAKAECPVVSNNSAHRFTPDVPMVVPEINADHIEIIPASVSVWAPSAASSRSSPIAACRVMCLPCIP